VIRVLILAASESEAEILAELAAEDDRIEIVASLTPASDAMPLDGTHLDVVLLSGVPVPQSQFAHVPIVVLADGTFDPFDHSNLVRARLPSNATPAEVLATLVAAAHGFFILTLSQAERQFRIPSARPAFSPPAEALTPRELQVLRMLAQGLANKEIADRLGISDHTAKFHVASILSKLQAATRTEAVTRGIQRGLVPI
jgi:DNA-binding NarL/FixJ family response regulator